MVIFTALPQGSSNDESRILVDESDYQGVDDEPLPFEVKGTVRIRANEKFSKHYDCMDEIGEGKFGKVYRCREKATGLQLAAKRIKIKRDSDREKVEREVAILTMLRHPRIAQIYDAFATPDDDVVLIMEVVNGGELFDRVVEESYILTELSVVMIICQLCEAISYIHSKNIVHLDIKPENIMCVSQTSNRIKLIDFGLAQFYDGSSNLLYMAGTPEFVAPEVIKFEPIDFYTDMWSIGVITYILLSGISPFLGETLGDTYVAVEKGEWEFDDEAFEGITDAAKDFISKLLIMDQKQRMLPEHCLNHTWIVESRTKAANNLVLNQPKSGAPLSKEGLKSYLRNKRFRKATWALVFLIRFKRQTLMNFGKRNYDSLPVSIGRIMRNCVESEGNTFTTAKMAQDGDKTEKVISDISPPINETFDTSRGESVIAIKHSEEKKLSSEIPKKKSKTSAIEDGSKKLKSTNEGKVNKGAKKHKERSSEKSDGISCKQKKVSKSLKTASDALEGQTKEFAEKISGYGEVRDLKKSIPITCEICTTLEIAKPATYSTEFSKPTFAAESAHLRSVISESAQTSMHEVQTEGKPKKHRVSSSGNQTVQESTQLNSSVNKPRGNNIKGSSVAAILSMFVEKAEQDRKRFESRPSRAVRTFRDVQKPSSRKTSLVVTAENGNCVKLYRAPEEEKERVKSLIELHRRGSKDGSQIETKENVDMKENDSSKNFLDQKVNTAEQGKAEMERSLAKRKMERNPALNAKKGTEWSRKKVTASNLSNSELSDIEKIDQITKNRSTEVITLAKTNCLRNELKEREKNETEFKANHKMVGGFERSAENVDLVETLQIPDLLAPQQKTAIEGDSNTSSKKTKSWMKPNKSQNDSSLKSLNATLEEPKHAKNNKQIKVVDEKCALSQETCLEETCTSKQEVTGNANIQNVHKRRKNKTKIIDKNSDTRGISDQYSADEKQMKNNVEFVATPGSSSLPNKAKQMTQADEKRSKIQESISVLQSLSADLTVLTNHNDNNSPVDQLQCTTKSKKTSKSTGISSRKKVVGETKVKKSKDKNDSNTKVISSALSNGESVVSEQNNLTERALHPIQNTVSSVPKSVDVFPSTKSEIDDAVKRNVSQKMSCSGNLLRRMKSEINLAKNNEKEGSVRTRQRAVDDDVIFGKQRDKSQKKERSISIVDLKNQENFSFGWLKLQLEVRVNKEQNDEMGWRYRRALKISPIESGNAKRALNLWKTMEQNNIAKI